MHPIVRVLVTVIAFAAVSSAVAAGGTKNKPTAVVADQGWLGLGFRCHAHGDPTGKRCDSLVVVALAPKGPAARAGLREHDVIVTIDGRPARFSTHRHALDQFRKFKRGQVVQFEVIRPGGRLRIRATAEPLPPEFAERWKQNYVMADDTDRGGRVQRKKH